MAYSAADRQRWVPEDHPDPSGGAGQPGHSHPHAHRDDFARDRARLVHSAALRRTAAKTQVMQPDTDDFVRNRLTHSLEVAQIGRELGAALGCHADVVDTACLAHDIGHPPFGHHGEAVLAELTGDIGGFEGNAQTFRLLTRLEAKRFHPDGRSAGLNLTRASLDAVLKYPWPVGGPASVDGSGATGDGTADWAGGQGADAPGAERPRKYGAYVDDLAAFAWVRRGAPPGRRCLEAQVMDWADDIGYSVHDVEDAVASGLLDLRVLQSRSDLGPVFDVARTWYDPVIGDEELAQAADRLRSTGVIVTGYDGSRRALAALKDMTSALIGRFASSAQAATRERYGQGPLIRYDAELVVPDATRAECLVLKSLTAWFVMLAPSQQAVRAGERAVVSGLVEAFAADPEARMDPVHLDDYRAAPDDPSRRRAVVDQVASLSDQRALALSRRWFG